MQRSRPWTSGKVKRSKRGHAWSSKGFIGGETSKSKTQEFVTPRSLRMGDVGPNVWFYSDLAKRRSTSNLDDQHPATLFYLGLVIDLEDVDQVYVEKLDSGRIKHWAILNERDYDIMDRIYEIEESTLDSFPEIPMSFRVSIKSNGTPTISDEAVKIFDRS